MFGITVRDFLDLVFEDGLPNGYRIYNFATSKNVYDSDNDENEYYDDNDEWLSYEVVSFDITESGVLEININTDEE